MSNKWSGKIAEWTDSKTAYLSVVFSWQLQEAFQKLTWYRSLGYDVRVGGPGIAMNHAMVTRLAAFDAQNIGASLIFDKDDGDPVDALPHHNPDATFTSRGCIRQCGFCAVPKIEGGLIELIDWEPRPIICDNNFLACSRRHFDHAIDKLKQVKGVDFNQGLDARLLSKYQADRLAELDSECMRLAWDNTKQERQFMKAFELLVDAGIPKSRIRVYILIGFDDTPEDALYRLETVKRLGALTNPSRYQPLDSKSRNEYVAVNWTKRQLRDYMRYWYNLRFLRPVPFEEYQRESSRRQYKKRPKVDSPMFQVLTPEP